MRLNKLPITPSVLGRSFVDAQFALLGAGLRITPPTLVLAPPFGGEPIPQLTVDNALMTCDINLTTVDADPNQAAPPMVIAQMPIPATKVAPGDVSAIVALGYPVPTPKGYRAVP